MFIFSPKNYGACGSIAPQYRALLAPNNVQTNEFLPISVHQYITPKMGAFTVLSSAGTVAIQGTTAVSGSNLDADGNSGSVTFTYSGLCPGDAYPATCGVATVTGTTAYFLTQG